MKNNKNAWGGEIAYSAPTLEELNVAVENGFAASDNLFLNTAYDDEYGQGAYDNGDY